MLAIGILLHGFGQRYDLPISLATMLLQMVMYTMTSLWILAQPITSAA